MMTGHFMMSVEICHQPLPRGAAASLMIPDLKRSSEKSRDPWTPPLLLSGIENRPDDGLLIICTTELYYKRYTVFVYSHRAATTHVPS